VPKILKVPYRYPFGDTDTNLVARLAWGSLAQGDPLTGEEAVALAAACPLALTQAARECEGLGRVC